MSKRAPGTSSSAGARAKSVLTWLLVLAAGGGAGYFYLRHYRPLVAQHGMLEAYHQQTTHELEQARHLLAERGQRVDNLDQRTTTLEKELEAASRTARTIQTDLATARTELESALKREFDSGDIAIIDADGQRGIRISAAALFKTGSTGLSGKGRKRLAAVAKALRQVPEQRLQIQGHVDKKPVVLPTTRRAHPTNWALSAGYAIEVLDFLASAGPIPTAQLSAAGFGDEHPVTGQKRGNDRVEIILLGRPAPKPAP